MPQGLQQFLQEITEINPGENGAEFAAGTPRLRVAAVAEGVFQVRFSQDGTPFREPPFSYAVVPDYFSTHRVEANLNTETDGYTRIECGGFAAVVQHRPLRVSFEDEQGNVFADDRYGVSWRGDKVAVWKNKVDGEHFYGMGERAIGINRLTRKFTNWNTDAPAYKEWGDPLYSSFPFFMALRPCEDGVRRAYGIYLDNSYRSEFDFGGEMLDGVDFCVYGGELVYYVIMGPDMTDVLRRYTEITGRAPLPPRWALGYQQSRWSYYPDTEVRTLVRQFRERMIPLDAVYLDIHYMEGYRVFTWDRERFPDPPGLLRDLLEDGVKVVPIVDPGIKADAGYAVNEDGLAQDMFVKYPDGRVYTGSVWPGACHFPDFTSPKVRSWFGGYCRQMLEDGAAGLWIDMNEPSNHRFRTLPDIVRHDFEGEGGTHAEAHNVYGLLMARATYDGMRAHASGERPFVLTRAGFSGVQRYAAMWTGDNVSDWEHLRLTTSMLLSLGMSGMPFAGSDVGGFFDSPSPELFARWIQLGAFSPLFRTHTIFHSQRQEPWSFGPAVETIARKFIELR
ncbi:MAG TPA: TIM-barrel domain-containing protein, partial [Rhodothermales bacterium]|nr:TIM-barrel domain-containing protein [Rhodothermales bacterium]